MNKKHTFLAVAVFGSAVTSNAQNLFTDTFGDGTIPNTSDINTNVPARQTGTTSSTYTGSGANNVFHVSNSDGITSGNNMMRMRNNEQTVPVALMASSAWTAISPPSPDKTTQSPSI